MSSSLDSLTTNLVRGGKKLFGFEEYTPEQYELLIRKGIYPCEYITEWNKLEENKLPPKEAFYRKLNMVGIAPKIMNILAKFGKNLELKT